MQFVAKPTPRFALNAQRRGLASAHATPLNRGTVVRAQRIARKSWEVPASRLRLQPCHATETPAGASPGEQAIQKSNNKAIMRTRQHQDERFIHQLYFGMDACQCMDCRGPMLCCVFQCMWENPHISNTSIAALRGRNIGQWIIFDSNMLVLRHHRHQAQCAVYVEQQRYPVQQHLNHSYSHKLILLCVIHAGRMLACESSL